MEIIGGVQGRRSYYALQKWSRGVVLRAAENPDGASFSVECLEGIMLDVSAPKITAECWTAMIELFIHCVEQDPRKNVGTVDANNEVCVVFAYRLADNHVIVAAMPQVVGHSRVSMDRTKGAVNLITGEKYAYWPPEGYGEIGDCHSHNTFGAFFSGTDDSDDRGLPGIHMVCGSFSRNAEKGWIYRIASSIVADNQRYKKVLEMTEDDANIFKVREMAYTDLTDITWVDDVTLHPGVLEVVHVDYPKDWKQESYGIVVHKPMSQAEAALLRDKYRREEKEDWETWRIRVGYNDDDAKRWVPKDPAHYTVEDNAFREKYGCWPDNPHAKTIKDYVDNYDKEKKEKKEDDFGLYPTAAQVLKYMGLRDDTPKDLPGQLSLYGGMPSEYEVPPVPEVVKEWWEEPLDEEFENIDAAFKYLRQIMDENVFRVVLAEYFNKLGIFKHIKPKRHQEGR